MAIITENCTGAAGTALKRTYSDQKKFIQNQNGVQYVEAVDIPGFTDIYTETDEDIPEEKLTPEEVLAMLEEVI